MKDRVAGAKDAGAPPPPARGCPGGWCWAARRGGARALPAPGRGAGGGAPAQDGCPAPLPRPLMQWPSTSAASARGGRRWRTCRPSAGARCLVPAALGTPGLPGLCLHPAPVRCRRICCWRLCCSPVHVDSIPRLTRACPLPPAAMQRRAGGGAHGAGAAAGAGGRPPAVGPGGGGGGAGAGGRRGCGPGRRGARVAACRGKQARAGWQPGAGGGAAGGVRRPRGHEAATDSTAATPAQPLQRAWRWMGRGAAQAPPVHASTARVGSRVAGDWACKRCSRQGCAAEAPPLTCPPLLVLSPALLWFSCRSAARLLQPRRRRPAARPQEPRRLGAAGGAALPVPVGAAGLASPARRAGLPLDVPAAALCPPAWSRHSSKLFSIRALFHPHSLPPAGEGGAGGHRGDARGAVAPGAQPQGAARQLGRGCWRWLAALPAGDWLRCVHPMVGRHVAV